MSTSSKTKGPRGKSSEVTRKPLASCSSTEEMSADDMRNVLFERLHNRGLLDTLKSQLRNYMVAELSGNTSRSQARLMKKGEVRTLEQRLLDSLIYKYLCDVGCDYTVGVFLPEAGITRREILNVEEMKKLLRLPNDVPTDKEDNSLLQLSIACLMKADGSQRIVHGGTQTDSQTLLLTDKLSHIDTEFSAKLKANEASGSVEERMLAYQRKVDLACSQKAQQDLERWKRMEMETLQITEREKVQRDLQDRRRQLEEEYRRKVAAITDREKALTDSVKVEYETVQRETFMQRQQLLQQSEQLRQRETELREEKNHIARLQRANEEKIEKLEQMLKKREAELEKKELHMDNTLRNQQERCRVEERLAYESKNRELKAWEDKLKDKESSIEREKRSMLTNSERKELLELRLKCQELGKQADKYKIETSGLEMKIVGHQERIAKMFDYEVIKETNISLKKDLEMTKERLDSLMKEHHFLQEKYEHMMIDGREKAGVGEIMLIKSQMQKERDKALDDKVLLEHRLKEMDVRFNDQMRKNEALMREFELQTDRQKYMNREYGELRKQMGESTVDTAIRSKRQTSPTKEPSFYDTSFRRSLPPELALDADWPADVSSGAEVSTATEESIVTETRKRLDHLTEEAENLHSAFMSLSRRGPPQSHHAASTHKVSSPMKSVRSTLTHSHVTFHSAVDIPPPTSHLPESATHLGNGADVPSYISPTAHVPASSTHPGSETKISTQLFPSTTAEIGQTTKDRYTLLPMSEGASQRSQVGEPLSQADQFSRATPNKQPVTVPVTEPAQVYPIKTTTSPPLDQSPHTGILGSLYQDPGPQANSSALNTVNPTQLGTVDPSPSLDSQWQSATVNNVPATSLDSQWKSVNANDTPQTSLDSQWKSQPVGVQPTSLDSQWPMKATSADTQQKSVSQQHHPQHTQSSAQGDGQTNVGGSAERSSSDKKDVDSMAGIDPLMQKYMKMVQQQKETEEKTQPAAEVKSHKSAPAASHVHEDEESISEHISLAKSDNTGGGATDEDFW